MPAWKTGTPQAQAAVPADVVPAGPAANHSHRTTATAGSAKAKWKAGSPVELEQFADTVPVGAAANHNHRNQLTKQANSKAAWKTGVPVKPASVGLDTVPTGTVARFDYRGGKGASPKKSRAQAEGSEVLAIDEANTSAAGVKPAWKAGLPKAEPIVTDAVPAGPALSREYCIQLQLRDRHWWHLVCRSLCCPATITHCYGDALRCAMQMYFAKTVSRGRLQQMCRAKEGNRPHLPVWWQMVHQMENQHPSQHGKWACQKPHPSSLMLSRLGRH